MTHWPFDPAPWLFAGLSLWGYRRAQARIGGWPSNRRACFIGGLAAVLLALATPIATYDGTLFWVHMVQHLLLTLVAAPLIQLSAPVTLALRAASPPVRAWMVSVLHSRVAKILGHPLVAWVTFALVMWVSHFSPLFDLALANEVVHVVQHAGYLIAGLLFWWPVVGLDPGAKRLGHPLRIVYLVTALPQQSWLGLAIYSASQVLYDHYRVAERSGDLSAFDDQRAAGIIMWVGGDFLFIIALVLAIGAWARDERREGERVDRRLGGTVRGPGRPG
ncbi:MAG: cytochrome c oxidase assembly protein [Actinomycetota bacterium]|nr:cytochrome c oxidase assembly protein [Actinomycetota bacterium]